MQSKKRPKVLSPFRNNKKGPCQDGMYNLDTSRPTDQCYQRLVSSFIVTSRIVKNVIIGHRVPTGYRALKIRKKFGKLHFLAKNGPRLEVQKIDSKNPRKYLDFSFSSLSDRATTFLLHYFSISRVLPCRNRQQYFHSNCSMFAL